MVRSIPGQGCLSTRNPPEPSGTGLPSMVTISGTTPGKGRVAEPGLVAIAPGIGLSMMCPVSVCHQVSTIGTAVVADDFAIPHPRLGIDRLADRAQQAQAVELVFLAATRRPT